MSTLSLRALAARAEARIHPTDADIQLSAIAPLHLAKAGEISFFTNMKLRADLKTTQAAALICKEPDPDFAGPQLLHPYPLLAMARVAQAFEEVDAQSRPQAVPVLSPLAFIDTRAELGSGVSVGPFVYIGAGARVGRGSLLHPGVYVGEGVVIGEDCVLHPGVVLTARARLGDRVVVHANAVLGADGFGFIPSNKGIEKIPQRGSVEVGDDVEVGALDSIDCATFEATKIGAGSKLDSHVHVGHNVNVGEESILCGFAAIAGSTKIGRRFVAGGGAMVGPGLNIAERVQLAGKAATTQDIGESGDYRGFPAQPIKQSLRQDVMLSKLPDLLKTIRDLEKRVQELEKN